MQLTDEQRLGFTYSSSDSDIWAPFSAKNYPEPPSKANIDKYGYDGATKRYLAQRNTIDTTWLAKYEYQPVDNPWSTSRSSIPTPRPIRPTNAARPPSINRSPAGARSPWATRTRSSK